MNMKNIKYLQNNWRPALAELTWLTNNTFTCQTLLLAWPYFTALAPLWNFWPNIKSKAYHDAVYVKFQRWVLKPLKCTDRAKYRQTNPSSRLPWVLFTQQLSWEENKSMHGSQYHSTRRRWNGFIVTHQSLNPSNKQEKSQQKVTRSL